MSIAIPESLQSEFSQDEWDNLTDAERQGMVDDALDDGNPTPEELERQEQEEREREEAAAAAAKAEPEKTDAEREDEARAAAAAKTNADTTAQQQQNTEQQTTAAQQQEEKPETLAPRPRGVVEAALPDDFDQQVKANDDAMASLEKRYEDGDISFAEYRNEQRALDKEARRLERLADRAELAKESSQQAMENQWYAVITPFTNAHPELSEDDVTRNAFDTYIRAETAKTLAAGGMPGQAEIDRAYANWCKRFNFKNENTSEPAKNTRQPNKVPPTLGGLPAASTTSVEDGKLAAISRLEGVAYEEALAKLTPAEVEQLSKFG